MRVVERYDRLDYTGPMVSIGFRMAVYFDFEYLTRRGGRKILIIGGGSGYEVLFLKRRGYEIVNVDLTAPPIREVKDVTLEQSAEELPFEDKYFDWVFSCETIEHIPYDTSLKVLKEAQRVARNYFITIAGRNDPPFNTHINIQNGEFWIGKLREMGCKVAHAQISPWIQFRVGSFIVNSKQVGQDGVMIVGEC